MRRFALLVLAALVASACGGGDSESSGESAPGPASSPEPTSGPRPTPEPEPTPPPRQNPDPTPVLALGEPDPTFGDDGVAIIPVGSRFETFRDGFLVDDAGRMVVLLALFGFDGDVELVRFHLDSDGGTESAELESLWFFEEPPLAAFTPAGGVVAVTERRDGSQRVARFTAEGVPDPRFGDGGFAEIALQDVSALFASPDGTVLIAGTGRRGLAVVVRLRPDGSLDAGFGDEGFLVAPGRVSDLATDSAGQLLLLIAWTSAPNFPPNVFVQAYLPDGSVDESFGEDGRAGQFVGWFGPRLYVSPTNDVLILSNGALYRVRVEGRVFGLPRLLASSAGEALAFYPRGPFAVVGGRSVDAVPQPAVPPVLDGVVDRRVLTLRTFGRNGTEHFAVEVDAGHEFSGTFGHGTVLAPQRRITVFGSACSGPLGSCDRLLVMRVGGR